MQGSKSPCDSKHILGHNHLLPQVAGVCDFELLSHREVGHRSLDIEKITASCALPYMPGPNGVGPLVGLAQLISSPIYDQVLIKLD